jgi:hypothetical protein
LLSEEETERRKKKKKSEQEKKKNNKKETKKRLSTFFLKHLENCFTMSRDQVLQIALPCSFESALGWALVNSKVAVLKMSAQFRSWHTFATPLPRTIRWNLANHASHDNGGLKSETFATEGTLLLWFQASFTEDIVAAVRFNSINTQV